MVTLTTALHPPEKVNTRHRDTKTHTEREKTGTYTENIVWLPYFRTIDMRFSSFYDLVQFHHDDLLIVNVERRKRDL